MTLWTGIIIVPELFADSFLRAVFRVLQQHGQDTDHRYPLIIVKTPASVLRTFSIPETTIHSPRDWMASDSGSGVVVEHLIYDPSSILCDHRQLGRSSCRLPLWQRLSPVLLPACSLEASADLVLLGVSFDRWPAADVLSDNPRITSDQLAQMSTPTTQMAWTMSPPPGSIRRTTIEPRIAPKDLHQWNALLHLVQLWDWPGKRVVSERGKRRTLDEFYNFAAEQFRQRGGQRRRSYDADKIDVAQDVTAAAAAAAPEIVVPMLIVEARSVPSLDSRESVRRFFDKYRRVYSAFEPACDKQRYVTRRDVSRSRRD